jgi:hypothetical protein
LYSVSTDFQLGYMSKTRQKNHKSELEYLQAKLKEREKLIRSLQSQIKYLDRRQHISEPENKEVTNEPKSGNTNAKKRAKALAENPNLCPTDSCGNILDPINVGIGTLLACPLCGYRKVNKNGQKPKG